MKIIINRLQQAARRPGAPTMIVCLCHSVSDREVREHVEHGCRTVGQVGRACGAGTDCGQCVNQLARMLRACAPSSPGGEPGVPIAQQPRVL